MSKIPVLLLKTRSQPDDGYEEYLSSIRLDETGTADVEAEAAAEKESSSPAFEPFFVPVLEHRPNTANLARIENLVRTGSLTERYGGMIFTSQRAVEGFGDVVGRVDDEFWRTKTQRDSTGREDNMEKRDSTNIKNDPSLDMSSAQPNPFSSAISPSTTNPFPLYVVGPATARSLNSILHNQQQQLLQQPPQQSHQTHPTRTPSRSPTLTNLHATILGAQTGNGANLATFILQHYNALHADLLFEYYEAPRLPFIPLVGPRSAQYGSARPPPPPPSSSSSSTTTTTTTTTQRMERDDERLKKKPLLFLVGEVRRDVIPRTLMDPELREDKRIAVDESEVYSTGVRHGFEAEFRALVERFMQQQQQQQLTNTAHVLVVVVVVFSPQGCEAMLRVLGCLGDDGRARHEVRRDRWRLRKDGGGAEWCGGGGSSSSSSGSGGRGDSSGSGETTTTTTTTTPKFVVATIGPTTRDHLIDTFGFEPDVCADKPSAEGVGEGVKTFLRSKGIIAV